MESIFPIVFGSNITLYIPDSFGFSDDITGTTLKFGIFWKEMSILDTGFLFYKVKVNSLESLTAQSPNFNRSFYNFT